MSCSELAELMMAPQPTPSVSYYSPVGLATACTPPRPSPRLQRPNLTFSLPPRGAETQSVGLGSHTPPTSPPVAVKDEATPRRQELLRRIRELRNEREHQRQLGEKATTTFERHRCDLDGLRLTEKRCFAATEDRLRTSLLATVNENARLTKLVAEAQREREEKLRQEMEKLRAAARARETALEGELRDLTSELASLHLQVQEAEEEQTVHEAALRRGMLEQVELQEQLQIHPCGWTDDLDTLVSSHRSSAACQLLEELHQRPREDASPEKTTGCFLMGGPLDVLRHPSPASHHVLSMVSSVERQNFLRPRRYHQRHHRDVHYSASPYRQRLNEMREMEESGASAATLAERRGICRPPPLVERTQSAAAVRTPSISHRISGEGPAHVAFSTRNNGAEVRGGGGSVPLRSPSPLSRGAPPSSSSRSSKRLRGTAAIYAACRGILEELVGLRSRYEELHHLLRDPMSANFAAASKEMRSIVVLMDRKAEQVRALRREQAKHGETLKVQDLLGQVAEENRYCRSVYEELLALIRS